jgi:diguanylate cyclase (GGDEF)-like protein
MSRISIVSPDYFKSAADKLCLESKGYKVIYQPDISVALERLLNDPPDILVIQKGLHRNLDSDVIFALKNNLQLALLPVILIVSDRDMATGLDWRAYPVDDLISSNAAIEELLTRIALADSRMHRVADNNPLTKLPGNSSILKAVQTAIDKQLARSVGYVDIDNFKPYNDRYGFASGDEVIRMVARVLVNTVQEHAGNDGFVGHVGGDDFVFMVPMGMESEVCTEVLDRFASLMPLFLDQEDIDAGCYRSVDRQGNNQEFDLTTLSIAVVPCQPGRYKHFGEVAAVAAQIKKKVKTFRGNNYLIDRRSWNKQENRTECSDNVE